MNLVLFRTRISYFVSYTCSLDDKALSSSFNCFLYSCLTVHLEEICSNVVNYMDEALKIYISRWHRQHTVLPEGEQHVSRRNGT